MHYPLNSHLASSFVALIVLLVMSIVSLVLHFDVMVFVTVETTVVVFVAFFVFLAENC